MVNLQGKSLQGKGERDGYGTLEAADAICIHDEGDDIHARESDNGRRVDHVFQTQQ